MARPRHTPAPRAITPEESARAEAEADRMLATINAGQLAEADRRDNAEVLARELTYDGELTIPALVEGIRHYQRRTVEDCLALGTRLCVLRELVDHGDWLPRIERLGFSERTARRFMLAARKTAKTANLAVLARGQTTVSRMLELLVLDDDEAGDLLAGETVRGIALDEVDTMTPSELRRQLRAARADGEAKDRVLADKSATIDRRETELARLRAERDQGSLLVQVAVADPDVQRQQLLAELLRRVAAVEVTLLGDLRLGIEAVREHADATGIPAEDAIAGGLAQIRRAIADLEYRLDIKPAPDGALAGSDAALWDAVGVDFDRQQRAQPDPGDRDAIDGELIDA